MSGDEEAEEQDLLSEIRDLEASNEAMYVREAGFHARIQELERERDGLVGALRRLTDAMATPVMSRERFTRHQWDMYKEAHAVLQSLVEQPTRRPEMSRDDIVDLSRGYITMSPDERYAKEEEIVAFARALQSFTDGEGVG